MGGAKEEAVSDNVFKDTGAGDLRSRDDCAGALAKTADVPGVPEWPMQ
jgi:hypothetical protein